MLRTDFKRHLRISAFVAVVALGAGLASACTHRHLEGGLIGGAVVGGAYEYQNKEALRDLERARDRGRISEREYRRRREEIRDRSLIY